MKAGKQNYNKFWRFETCMDAIRKTTIFDNNVAVAAITIQLQTHHFMKKIQLSFKATKGNFNNSLGNHNVDLKDLNFRTFVILFFTNCCFCTNVFPVLKHLHSYRLWLINIIIITMHAIGWTFVSDLGPHSKVRLAKTPYILS